jgi:hypothetical protein
MQVKEKMCPVRDQYPSIATDSIRFKTINFSKEAWNMYNCSIANDTERSLVENTRWNRMKGKFLAFRVVDGVPSICSTLINDTVETQTMK